LEESETVPAKQRDQRQDAQLAQPRSLGPPGADIGGYGGAPPGRNWLSHAALVRAGRAR
jgi:hypothetical protein